MTCTSSNTSFCTSCFQGYNLLSNNTCEAQCSKNCFTCDVSGSDSCGSCSANKVLNSDKTCGSITNSPECGPLCYSCSQSSKGVFTCDICSPGTMMYKGNCISCPQNCATCSESVIGICTSCLPGYYFDNSLEVCTQCAQENCVSCTALGCLACRTGYMVSPNFNCQKECVFPCATCSETDPSICLSCIAGFNYDEGATQNCVANLTCSDT